MIQYYERIGFIQTSLVTSLPVHLYQPFRYAVTSSAINARSFFATPTSNGNRNLQEPLPHAPKARTRQRFREFDLQGKVYVVTGGARGLGLSMSEALVEPGGQVSSFDAWALYIPIRFIPGLPLSVKGMSDSIQCTKSSGGLVAALSGLTNSMKCRWLGWPGISPQGPEEEGKVSESLAAHDARAIFLDPQLAHDHYNRFSNSILWPILHYQSGVSFDENAWNAYQRVNSLFAEAVADEANDNDLIWVHDYHLLLVPSMLRNRLQEQGKHCAVGFTLHTPFPAGDFWRALPVHKELLEGVLASDVVGFHTDEYKHNFIQGCAHGLDAASASGERINYKGEETLAGTFIVGIDPQKFTDTMLDPNVQERVKELEEVHKNKTVIIGVDRLDYTKGLVQKLKGYGTFLEQHPELSTKVIFIQVAVPSREDVKEYQELELEVCRHVGNISGQYATAEGSPLLYIHRSVPFNELTALYCISDVCLLTSRRDGMNLVASEYISCQWKRHGVLVLSELAGAASFLDGGSIIFHPSREQEMVDAMYKAVTMDQTEKEKRFRKLIDFVTTHTSAKWGAAFINTLERYLHNKGASK